MREVSIQQLWNRAWDLFKVNWLLLLGLLLGLLVLYVIVSFLISDISGLIAMILLSPALVRAGYLVALKGQSSFGEAFRDLSSLLKISVYQLILVLIPEILIGILIGFEYMPVLGSAIAGLSEASMEGGYGGMRGSMVFSGTGVILLWLGYILIFILSLFGWAGPYAILSGRAGIFSAIGQSFSLTAQNFGKVFLAFLLFIGLGILGAIPCGVGLLVVLPMWYVFLPLLYLALTGEEGVPHS
jgi:uncharacterized membrane protein